MPASSRSEREPEVPLNSDAFELTSPDLALDGAKSLGPRGSQPRSTSPSSVRTPFRGCDGGRGRERWDGREGEVEPTAHDVFAHFASPRPLKGRGRGRGREGEG